METRLKNTGEVWAFAFAIALHAPIFFAPKAGAQGGGAQPLAIRNLDGKAGPGATLELRNALDVTPSEVAYIGDDLQDLAVMTQVGLAATVADAHPQVLARAHWTAAAAGGRGAVRELCEFILDAQGKLAGIVEQRFIPPSA